MKNKKLIIIVVLVLSFVIGILVIESYINRINKTVNDNGEYNNKNNSSNNDIIDDQNNDNIQDSVNISIKKEKYKDDNVISAGDEYSIGTEHFYVLLSNDNETSLLAKYNLYVGNNYKVKPNNSCALCFDYELNKKLTENDAGYGLQNKNALGLMGNKKFNGIVPFSGKNYWCKDNSMSSDYMTDLSIERFDDGEENVYAYIYDENRNAVIESSSFNKNEDVYLAKDNEYTIAYYVQNYITKLIELGAPNDIKGRLLNYDEHEVCFSETDFCFTSAFWTGFTRINNCQEVRAFIGEEGSMLYPYNHQNLIGVRPVIVLKTKYLK